METKHTKGEWQPKQFKNSVIVNNQDLINQTIICQIFGSGEEAEANAKLIAEAPELLEALIECKNLLEKTPYENLHLQDLVCNAINKATK